MELNKIDVILFTFFIIIWVSILVLVLMNETQVKPIGNMVCDEQGLGEFKGFHKNSKTIKCLKEPTKIRYDGGYIQIVMN